MAVTAATTSELRDAERDLVQRHRYGDAAAFTEIYKRFETMVYNLALRLTGDAADAADCTQETFVRVYRHLEGFKGKSSLQTWVYRIALNHCRSHGRRQSVRRRLFGQTDEHLLARVADRAASPEEVAIESDMAQTIVNLLPRVRPLYREAVVLRDMQGLSYEEIADILGVRIGTVRSRIARGRERIRNLLEAQR